MIPKVSVCVPVFKVERYIERCVVSICNQTLDELEIIFINDQSPDKSWKILKETIAQYPQRLANIILLENASNLGPAISRQRCAQVATGEYIYFADSDDWLDKDMLATMYNIAVEKKADIVGTDIFVIPPSGTPFTRTYRTFASKNEWISNMI